MKILFRALLLLIAFFIVLGIVKFLFVKLFFLALWIGTILLVAYILISILKRA
jgi:hypothetical protein